MDEIYEERSAEFGENYEYPEENDIAALLEATGSWLELLTMETEVVDQTLRLLIKSVFDFYEDPGEGASWRDLLERADKFAMRSVQFMVGLSAFAFWGLPPSPNVSFYGVTSKTPDISSVIEAYIALARKLQAAAPNGWGSTQELTKTVLAAEARFRLDMDKDVTIEQLAALAQISPKSIRNLLTPKAGGEVFETNAAGEIRCDSALRWLLSRSDFKTSIWQEGLPPSRAVRQIETDDLGDVLFVPVAKDGSWFDPISCQTKNGYMIGPKGAEETIADYRAALERLARMPTPYWRRPNNLGNRGIVAGVSWQRKVVSDLGLESREDA